MFRLTARADDGDICGLRTIEITAHDNAQTLYEKVMFWGARLFADTVTALSAGTLVASKQKTKFAEYYPQRTPDDGIIDFSGSVEEVSNFIRAQSRPYPGAFTFLDGRRCFVWQAIPFDSYAFRERIREPGMILAALPSGLVVQTGSSCIWLQSVVYENGEKIVPGPLDDLEALVGKQFSRML